MFKKAGGAVAQTQKAKRQIEEQFMKAVELGKVEDVRKAIKKGVDVNLVNPEHEQFTALHVTAEKGDVNVAKVLITQKSLNMNLRSRHGNTPLMVGVQFNMLDIIKLLLRFGANPNIQNYAGKTALHIAVYRDYAIIVELLSLKANPNIRDAFDNTPLSLCIIERPSMEKAKLLLKNGANPNLETMKAHPLLLELCLNSKTDMDLLLVRLLLDYGADPNITNSHSKQTALHMASVIGSVPLANLLIKMEANPTAKDLLRRTPLDVAKDHEHHDLVAFYKHRKFTPKASVTPSETSRGPLASIISIGSNLFDRKSKVVKFTEYVPSEEEMYLQQF